MKTTTSYPADAPINDHFDGLGLNDRIRIETDEKDPNSGGAKHAYRFYIKAEKQPTIEEMEKLIADSPRCIYIDIEGAAWLLVGELQFQQGPRGESKSIPGLTEAAVMAVLIDRLRDFQAGPYSCRENAIQLTKLEEAMHWTRHRAEGRAKRGVLGKNVK